MTPALPIAAAFALVLAAGVARNVISSRLSPPIGGGGLSSSRTPSAPVGAEGVSTGAAASTGERRDCNRGKVLDAGQPAGEQTRLYTGREQSLCGFDSHRPHSVLLDSICHCESAGSDVSTPNHAGALGPYQFLRPTWDDHARGVPWSRAVDEPTARVVAARYLAWIERTVTRWQGRPATVEQVCAAWNGGIGRLRSVDFDVSRMPAESREFVRRVNKRMEVQR